MKNPQSILEKTNLYLNLTLERHREGHLPVGRQILEMLGVALLTGNGPGFYHMAGFYRRSIPWRDKYQPLISRKYKNRLRKLNPDTYPTFPI